MGIIAVDKDLENFTLTVTAEYDVPAERAWQLWSDPRQLERWWGPPEYPATVEAHELTPGGAVAYFMTSPEGERYPGWWRVLDVEPPRRLRVEDGFADQDGKPNEDLPTTLMEVRIDDRAAGGVRITITSSFPSLDALEQLVQMGMEEGLKAAMGQIDAILAE